MKEELFNQIKEFTIREARLPESRQQLDLNTRLHEDLGLIGDDAIDFLIAYGNQFNVDLSQFKASEYFTGKEMNPLYGDHEKKPLTLEHLVKGAIANQLDEEVINRPLEEK